MKPSKGLILCLVALWPSFSVLADGALAAAKSWYVDAWVYQSGDGTSWEKAFKTIQEGINATGDGDTVTVAEGTYQENIQFKGKNIVLTGTNPLDPDVIAKTVIQGQQLGPAVTFSGTEKPSCSLSGFTVWDGKWGNGGAIRGNGTLATIGMNVITGGTADGYGGGLYGCDGLIYLNIITVNSSGLGGGGLASCNGPIQFNVISLCWSREGGALYKCLGPIQHNTITDCVTSGNGAGLSDCDGDILNNTITNCAAESQWSTHGGGLYDCDGDILNNTIAKCSAYDGGGLAYCGKAGETSARIANNTITENKASSVWGAGGGLSRCDGTIENNTITKNSASSGGGLDRCGGLIQNNLIAGNRADSDKQGGSGGGLELCLAQIRNNLITANSADTWGGGLSGCDGTLENNTIAGNQAGMKGGGLYKFNGTIRNCIVWGNTAGMYPQLAYGSVPSYSCIQDWFEGGEGNIALNPRLCDPDGPDDDFFTLEDNDCHLDWDSPCIDAGKNEPWMWGALDLDGNNRVFPGGKSATVDMGAYEYGSFRFTIVGVERTSSDQLKLTWTSRSADTYAIMWTSDLLSQPWFQADTVPSQGDLTTWSSGTVTPPQRFYVVELR